MTSEVIATMEDVRAVKLCARGSRAWCKSNGINWADFVANGIPAATLEATGDPIVARVAAHARQRVGGLTDGR